MFSKSLKLTQKVVVEHHSKLGQLHGPRRKLHGEHVARRSEAVDRHPQVTPESASNEGRKEGMHTSMRVIIQMLECDVIFVLSSH